MNALKMVAGKYISALLIGGFYFYLAKVISKEEFGVYSAVESLVLIFTFFSLTSMDNITQNYAIKYNFSASKIIWSSFKLKLVSSLLGVGLFLLSLQFILPESSFVSYFVFLVIVFNSSLVFLTYFISKEKYMRYSQILVVSSVLSVIFKLLFIKYFEELVVLTIVFDSFFLGMCAFIMFINSESLTNSKNYADFIFSKSKYFLISSFVILIYDKIDQVMLAKMIGFESVAEYALPMKFVSALILIASVYNLSFVPTLTRLYKEKNNKLYLEFVRKFMMYTYLVAAIISMANYIITPYIINYFYGWQYSDSQYYSKLLSLIVFFIFISSSVGRILIVEGLGVVALYRNLIAVIINVLLNILLIPVFMVEGAIISSIISCFIAAVLYPIMSKKSRHIFKLGKLNEYYR